MWKIHPYPNLAWDKGKTKFVVDKDETEEAEAEDDLSVPNF